MAKIRLHQIQFRLRLCSRPHCRLGRPPSPEFPLNAFGIAISAHKAPPSLVRVLPLLFPQFQHKVFDTD